MPGHYVSRFFRAFGPLLAPSTACAAGTQSVGEASEIIRSGRADMVITGGVEAVLQDYSIAGFEAMDALSTGYNDNPEAARPPLRQESQRFCLQRRQRRTHHRKPRSRAQAWRTDLRRNPGA